MKKRRKQKESEQLRNAESAKRVEFRKLNSQGRYYHKDVGIEDYWASDVGEPDIGELISRGARWSVPGTE